MAVVVGQKMTRSPSSTLWPFLVGKGFVQAHLENLEHINPPMRSGCTASGLESQL